MFNRERPTGKEASALAVTTPLNLAVACGPTFEWPVNGRILHIKGLVHSKNRCASTAEACGSLRKPAEACGLRQLTRKLKDYAERQFGDVELTKQVPGSSSISAKVARWVPDAAGSSISPGPRHPAILAISATVFLGFGG